MIGRVFFGLAGAALGLWCGFLVSACSSDDCNCPPTGEIVLGTFPVSAVNAHRGQSAPPFELEAATVTITDQAVSVQYSRAGTDVTVTYAVERKYE